MWRNTVVPVLWLIVALLIIEFAVWGLWAR